MTSTIRQLVEAPETLVAMEPEQLAGLLLEHIKSLPSGDDARWMPVCAHRIADDYPAQYKATIRHAVAEAWAWLEREGLIAHVPEYNPPNEKVFVTRRGRELKTQEDVEQYRKASLLPTQFLHPKLARVVSAFLRGEYDVAVFQAFKQLEVAVRDGAGYDPNDASKENLGVNLIRRAFHPERGPLTDMNIPVPEREALQALFAGSVGLYKNPHSHRDVPLTDAMEAVEIVLLANHLLRIVDVRAAAIRGTPPSPP